MNEKNIEKIVKHQFDQSTYDDDYNKLWDELEPRLPKKKRRFLIWFFLSIFFAPVLFLYITNPTINDHGEVANTLMTDTNIPKQDDQFAFVQKNKINSLVSQNKKELNKKPEHQEDQNGVEINFLPEEQDHIIPTSFKDINVDNEIAQQSVSSNFGNISLMANSRKLDVNDRLGSLVKDNLSEIEPLPSIRSYLSKAEDFGTVSIQDYIITPAKKSFPLIMHFHAGLPLSNKADQMHSNEHERLIDESLKLRKSLQLALEVPFSINENFDLSMRLSYLTIEERQEINGIYQLEMDSLNSNAFLVNGSSSIGTTQSYTKRLSVNFNQTNQIELVKLSPSVTYKTGGKTIFGMTVMPEYTIYQNYRGLLLNSNFEQMTNKEVSEFRKFNKLNWSMELFLGKQFFKSTFCSVSIQYSRLGLNTDTEALNSLKSVDLFSIGTSIHHKF